MLIARRNSADPKPSEITPESLFAERRQFLKLSAAALTLAAVDSAPRPARAETEVAVDFPALKPSPYSTGEEPTPFRDITRYNNFYEFGTDKTDPERNAHTLRVRPWTVSVDGEVHKPKVFDIEELLGLPQEERIYRLRCVEAWSMVIPWVGFPLAELLRRVEPTGKARFVEFTTLLDPAQMPGQNNSILLDWPYVEGLRLDEAMHPLTLLAVGVYGKLLPNQNGAPLRLVVPWKYGFKSVKSIVRIRLTEQMPTTTWMKAGPGEYGFYANVNPEVEHPRWSQSRERRIGEFFKRPTLVFNGYGERVAGLYAGMDLRKYF